MATIAERLLSHIVAMDRLRILGRLRSRHAKWSRKVIGRKPLAQVLLQTVAEASSRPGCTPRQKELRKQCQQLENTTEQLESNNTPKEQHRILIQTVQLFHSLDISDMGGLLSDQREVNSCTQDYLSKNVRKLARYAEVARNLANAARNPKYLLFRHIAISGVSFKQIEAQSFRSTLETFDKSLMRLKMSINPSDKKPGALEIIRQNHEKCAWKANDSGKVHAEIQLLFFYEASKQARRPRVICSSKSACYLCDLFIKCHGKFSIPQTHGRIYNKWTFPAYMPQHKAAFADLLRAATMMNDAIEGRISVLASSQRPRLAPPNESVVGICQPWSTTSTLVPLQEVPSPTDGIVAGASEAPAPHEVIEESKQTHYQPSLATLSESERSQHLSTKGASFDIASTDIAVVHTTSLTLDLSMSNEAIDEHRKMSDEQRPIRVTVKPVTDQNCSGDSGANVFPVDVNAIPTGCETVVAVGPGLPQNRLSFATKSEIIEVKFEYVPLCV